MNPLTPDTPFAIWHEYEREYAQATADAAAEIWNSLHCGCRPDGSSEPREEICDCGLPWLSDHSCNATNQAYWRSHTE